MKNLKTRNKFMLALGIIGILIVILGYFAIGSLTSLNSQFTQYREEVFTVDTLLLDMRVAIQRLSKDIGSLALNRGDATTTDYYVNDALASVESVTQNLAKIQAVTTNADILSGVNSFAQLVSSTSGELMNESALRAVGDMLPEEASAVYFQNYAPVLEQAMIYAIDASEAAEALEDTTFTGILSYSTLALYIIVGVAIAVILVLVIVGLLLIRSFRVPIEKIESAVAIFATGELDKVNVDYDSRDEMGSLAANVQKSAEILGSIIDDLSKNLALLADGHFAKADINKSLYVGKFKLVADSMNTFVTTINGTLQNVEVASKQVSSGSDQVSSAAQSLAQGATEQASSVQELAASVNDISEQVRINADNAGKAQDMAEQATEVIASSNEKMQMLMESMSQIDSKSKDINKIIKTIEDIAFQTNILALNAAVEAARAGAAGKGFAVVADEVRNLAGKSADAAKNTTMLIEESIAAIDTGVRLAEVTAEGLSGAVSGAHETTQTIQQIAQASGEQAAAIAQIKVGIEQISAVVETNSATSEETAAASEELSSQSDLLKDLIANFDIEGGTAQQSGARRQKSAHQRASIYDMDEDYDAILEMALDNNTKY